MRTWCIIAIIIPLINQIIWIYIFLVSSINNLIYLKPQCSSITLKCFVIVSIPQTLLWYNSIVGFWQSIYMQTAMNYVFRYTSELICCDNYIEYYIYAWQHISEVFKIWYWRRGDSDALRPVIFRSHLFHFWSHQNLYLAF